MENNEYEIQLAEAEERKRMRGENEKLKRDAAEQYAKMIIAATQDWLARREKAKADAAIMAERKPLRGIAPPKAGEENSQQEEEV